MARDTSYEKKNTSDEIRVLDFIFGKSPNSKDNVEEFTQYTKEKVFSNKVLKEKLLNFFQINIFYNNDRVYTDGKNNQLDSSAAAIIDTIKAVVNNIAEAEQKHSESERKKKQTADESGLKFGFFRIGGYEYQPTPFRLNEVQSKLIINIKLILSSICNIDIEQFNERQKAPYINFAGKISSHLTSKDNDSYKKLYTHPSQNIIEQSSLHRIGELLAKKRAKLAGQIGRQETKGDPDHSNASTIEEIKGAESLTATKMMRDIRPAAASPAAVTADRGTSVSDAAAPRVSKGTDADAATGKAKGTQENHASTTAPATGKAKGTATAAVTADRGTSVSAAAAPKVPSPAATGKTNRRTSAANTVTAPREQRVNAANSDTSLFDCCTPFQR
jgi:hypothetical protein